MSFQWAWNHIFLLLGVHGKLNYLILNNIFLCQGILLIESAIFAVNPSFKPIADIFFTTAAFHDGLVQQHPLTAA